MGVLHDLNFKGALNQTSILATPSTTSSQLLINSYLSDIRILFSNNKIDYASSLYFVIFGSLVTSLIVCCLTSRHRKGITFTVGFLLLLSYFAIAFGLHDPHWCIGNPESEIFGAFSYLDKTTTWRSNVSVKIGLTHFNVSLSAYRSHQTIRIDLEEKFLFAPDVWDNDYHTLADAKTGALQRGLPDPILTLAEYFGSEGYGFRWGPLYTLAGDRAKVALEFALATLILTTILMVVIPFYGLVIFPLVGFLLVTSCITYCGLIPSFHDAIYIQGVLVDLQFGHTIFVVLFVGLFDAIVSFIGICLYKLDVIHDVGTFFEVDYDTAFDKKTISEDMKNRKLFKSKLRDSRFRKSLRFKSSFWHPKSSGDTSPPGYFSDEVIKPPKIEDVAEGVSPDVESCSELKGAQRKSIICTSKFRVRTNPSPPSSRPRACDKEPTEELPLKGTPVKVHVEFYVEL